MLINDKQFELFTSQFENKEEEINKVEVINLEVNELKSIPRSIVIFKYLEYLYMNCNNIKIIPSYICELKYLKYLYLYGNQIKEIPFEISLLNNLEVLVLSNNKLINSIRFWPGTGATHVVFWTNPRCNGSKRFSLRQKKNH